MQVQIEAVLHGGAINFRDQAAGTCKRHCIQSRPLAHLYELIRRAPRVSATATAHVQPKFILNWRQTALERPDYARRNPRRMPVHSHDAAERLEPEGVRKPPQQLV